MTAPNQDTVERVEEFVQSVAESVSAAMSTLLDAQCKTADKDEIVNLLCEADEACQEAIDAIEAMGDEWQPIETAPKKQGEDILVARFDDDGSYWVGTAQWWVRGWAFFYGRTSQSLAPILLCFEPTHWRPTPKPLA